MKETFGHLVLTFLEREQEAHSETEICEEGGAEGGKKEEKQGKKECYFFLKANKQTKKTSIFTEQITSQGRMYSKTPNMQ